MAKQNLKQMAVDCIKGTSTVGQYTKANLSEAIKNQILEVVGGEWNYYTFEDNKNKVFAILAETLPAAINASLGEKFTPFADFKDTELGDKNYFRVLDKQLFPVYVTARGTQDIERTKLMGTSFTVGTDWHWVSIYSELDEFMAGKVDFAEMTMRVAASYAHNVGNKISTAIYNSYSSVGTNYKATGAFDEDTLDTIIEHVKASNNVDSVQIFGAPKALRQVNNSFGYSDNMLDAINELGFVGVHNGTPLFALPQAYDVRTQTFAVDRSHLIILPANEKIVKVVFEGMPIVRTNDGMDRNDMQMEYKWGRMVGASAITVQEGNYGFYKLS